MRNKKILIGVLIFLSTVYIVYEHTVDADSIPLSEQYKRHQDLLNMESEFYNPWQYRIFSTYLQEGVSFVISPLVPEIGHPSFKEFQPYISVIVLKFLTIGILLYMFIVYLGALDINNDAHAYVLLMILTFQISNSTFASGHSINTYFDIIFYLAGAILVLKNKTFGLIPVVFFAALNRETSGLIPFLILYTIKGGDWKGISLKSKRVVVLLICLFVYSSVFIGTRLYFGSPDYHGGLTKLESPLDFFLFNLTFPRSSLELFGTLGFLPILYLFYFRKINHDFILFSFLLIVPAWFAIHFFFSQVSESRMFLVPNVLVFLPGIGLLLDQRAGHNNKSTS